MASTTPRSIVVTHTVRGNDEAVFPRLVIDAGENSEVTVVERFVSDGAGAALVVPRLFVRTQQAARVTYVAINELSTSVWQLGHQQAIGERDSTTLLATVALGGEYARVRTDVKVVGQGASTRQVALYYADDTQMHDFRTLQDHVAPRTTSDLLFKGAVQDTARSVYTGLIRIGHDAKGSVAYQTNRNLTLSAGAWAESVPEPGDRDQRREVQPRQHDRPDRRGAAVLSREPGHPAGDRRATGRAGFLRRGARPTAGRPAGRRAARPGCRQARSAHPMSTVVCPLTELAPNSATRFDVDGRAVAVVRIGDDVYAIGDTCSHANVSLSEGELWCDTKEIECWKHGSTFSLVTGEPQTLPATQPVPVYVARVVDGMIEIDLEAQ